MQSDVSIAHLNLQQANLYSDNMKGSLFFVYAKKLHVNPSIGISCSSLMVVSIENDQDILH